MLPGGSWGGDWLLSGVVGLLWAYWGHRLTFLMKCAIIRGAAHDFIKR